jgi:PAS domain S-box-containing protein
MKTPDRMANLAHLLTVLLRSPIPSDQFQALAEHTGHVIAHDFLAICLVDPIRQGYRVHSLSGSAGGAIPNRLFTFEEGIAGHVIQNRQPCLIANLSEEPNATPDFEGICLRLGLNSALVAPLSQGNKALGTLYLAARETNAFNTDDLAVATLLASGLSGALENARVYQLLADERSMFEAILRSTQDGVLMANVRGRILMANPAVAKMLGQEEAELTGRYLHQAVDNQALKELFDSGRAGVVEVPLADGRITQASLVPATTGFGEQVGWAAVLRDITLLKELEQMKNEFVSTVSHDLKNPIGAMMMAADLLPRAGSLNDEQEDLRQRLLQTADYMKELVNDLLDLGRIQAGLGLDHQAVDLVEVVQEVIETLKPQAEAANHQLIADLTPAAAVMGDAGRLKQVVLNLVGNAIKYTPVGGRIHVAVSLTTGRELSGPADLAPVPDGHLTLLKVRDTGLGIPPLDRPHVFEKFYRVHSAETADISGTGLGLSIAQSIVEAHHGRIWVESKEGQGSTFTFYLPAAEDSWTGR